MRRPRTIGKNRKEGGELCIAVLRHQTRHAVAASPAAWLADHAQKWRLEVGQEDRAIARHSAILPKQKQNSKANSRTASATCCCLRASLSWQRPGQKKPRACVRGGAASQRGKSARPGWGQVIRRAEQSNRVSAGLFPKRKGGPKPPRRAARLLAPHPFASRPHARPGAPHRFARSVNRAPNGKDQLSGFVSGSERVPTDHASTRCSAAVPNGRASTAAIRRRLCRH